MRPTIITAFLILIMLPVVSANAPIARAENPEGLAIQDITPTTPNNTVPKTTEPEPVTAEEHRPLYQVDYKSVKPITGITIGEHPSGEVFASLSASQSLAGASAHALSGTHGEKFLLFIEDSGDGGQLLHLVSEYANRLRIRVSCTDGTGSESLSSPPRELLNCTLDKVAGCTPGAVLLDSYADCTRKFAGFIEVIITDADGTQNEFKRDIVNPLRNAQEWDTADVWVSRYNQIGKGYYAEVRVRTYLCREVVAHKLNGNPQILAEEGRQINVNYPAKSVNRESVPIPQE